MKAMYPKMLPWLARRAGISDAAVEFSWREAVHDATDDSFVPESPDFWKSAVDHLLERISAQSRNRYFAPQGQGRARENQPEGLTALVQKDPEVLQCQD
jgi:hypothetical protein